jgi:hypothetical protein
MFLFPRKGIAVLYHSQNLLKWYNSAIEFYSCFSKLPEKEVPEDVEERY